MIWFILATAVMLVTAVIVLLRPFLVAGGGGEGLPDSEIYRRQVAEIASDLEAGNISNEEAETARSEVTRRLLVAVDREAAGSRDRAPSGHSHPYWLLGLIGGFMIIGSVVIYGLAGRPDALIAATPQIVENNPARMHAENELARDVTLLQDRLKKDPTNAEGWMLLGRTLASLQRLDESQQAYSQAVRYNPHDASLHAQLGEVMTVKAGEVVTPEAAAEFAKAPNDPRARYYLAIATAQHGDTKGAVQQLQALLKDAPKDAPWRQVVAARLSEYAGQTGGGDRGPNAQAEAPRAAEAPVSGPSAADIQAAQQMSPEARLEMIRSMVNRLAARMEQNPTDKLGWERLARAYEVLNEPDKAAAARAQAAKLP